MRGQVYRVDLGHGRKPWVVVSNNARNRHLTTVLAARITTTGKHSHVPTVVPLSGLDPLVGWVLCDDLVPLYRDELEEAALMGTLAPSTMTEVSVGLRIALP